jgi:hypothetical protein
MKVCTAGVEAFRNRVQNPGDPCVHRDDVNNLLVKVEAIIINDVLLLDRLNPATGAPIHLRRHSCESRNLPMVAQMPDITD